ncbi:phage protein [Bacillus sp. JCM 19046]|nr:phage protein [Bacillus sp. JCM 19045]GAF18905.1 phage protein [Bacillus sp. JCM 19046]
MTNSKVNVIKGNRLLTISEDRLNAFLEQGYDQVDSKGEVVKRATGGKNVSIGEYNKLLDQLEEAKGSEGLENLKEENKKLKAENTKLKKEADAAKKGE